METDLTNKTVAPPLTRERSPDCVHVLNGAAQR